MIAVPLWAVRLPWWAGWVTLALVVAVFVVQLRFFLAWGTGIIWPYVINHAWILAWLLVVTTFTRTVPLRLLAAFWFVGVYTTLAIVLFVGGPITGLFGLSNALVPGLLLPLVEELVKPLPVLAFFWYMVRRGWQPGPSDGLLIGFVIGAGFAFHEDMMFGRVWGSGLQTATPLSALFPTISYFRGTMAAYHDAWLALIGLAIGAAFLLRGRSRLAWALPAAAWLIVFTDHWTGNYLASASSGEALVGLARAMRGLGPDGALPVMALAGGIVVAVAAELLILRSVARHDALFPSPRAADLAGALRGLQRREVRRLQALREYARLRRSTHFTVWARRPRIEPAHLVPIGAELYRLAGLAQLRPGTAFDEEVAP